MVLRAKDDLDLRRRLGAATALAMRRKKRFEKTTSSMKKKVRAVWCLVCGTVRLRHLIRCHLTAGERTLVKQIYDSSGGLTGFVKIREVLAGVGQNLTDGELHSLLDHGTYREGHIMSLVQFESVMETLKRRHQDAQDTDTGDAFVALGGQRDKSGEITTKQLRDIVKHFNLTINIDKLIAEVDKNGSGLIDYLEFSSMLEPPPEEGGTPRGPDVRKFTLDPKTGRPVKEAIVGGWWQMAYSVTEPSGEASSRTSTNGGTEQSDSTDAEAVAETSDAVGRYRVCFDDLPGPSASPLLTTRQTSRTSRRDTSNGRPSYTSGTQSWRRKSFIASGLDQGLATARGEKTSSRDKPPRSDRQEGRLTAREEPFPYPVVVDDDPSTPVLDKKVEGGASLLPVSPEFHPAAHRPLGRGHILGPVMHGLRRHRGKKRKQNTIAAGPWPQLFPPDATLGLLGGGATGLKAPHRAHAHAGRLPRLEQRAADGTPLSPLTSSHDSSTSPTGTAWSMGGLPPLKADHITACGPPGMVSEVGDSADDPLLSSGDLSLFIPDPSWKGQCNHYTLQQKLARWTT